MTNGEKRKVLNTIQTILQTHYGDKVTIVQGLLAFMALGKYEHETEHIQYLYERVVPMHGEEPSKRYIIANDLAHKVMRAWIDPFVETRKPYICLQDFEIVEDTEGNVLNGGLVRLVGYYGWNPEQA